MVKALTEARLNAYALNPTTVSVSVPPISGEQRAEIAHQVKKLGEEAKIAIRSIRQVARKKIEVTGRGSQRRVQEATDEAVAEIERLVKNKTKRLSEKACLTIVGWVQPTAFSGELVGCTHPTKSFPDSL